MNAPASTPRLVSAGLLVRADGALLLLRHARGPFAGRWSPLLAGVADQETAEDALVRLLRDTLRVEHDGPFEFLDTLSLAGSGGEQFVVNAFRCEGWTGVPALVRGAYDDAVWAPRDAIYTLDLLPELRVWLLFGGAGGGKGE